MAMIPVDVFPTRTRLDGSTDEPELTGGTSGPHSGPAPDTGRATA